MAEATHLPGCDLAHGRRQRCSTWAPAPRDVTLAQPVDSSIRHKHDVAAPTAITTIGAAPRDELFAVKADESVPPRRPSHDPDQSIPSAKALRWLTTASLIVNGLWATLWFLVLLFLGSLLGDGTSHLTRAQTALALLVISAPAIVSTLMLFVIYTFRDNPSAPLIGLAAFIVNTSFWMWVLAQCGRLRLKLRLIRVVRGQTIRVISLICGSPYAISRCRIPRSQP